MSKNADPKTFLRATLAGFRYSRAPDTTPPSVPVLSPPVPGIGLISIQWVNGLDAITGIGATYAEISPNGANTWTRTVVPYPGTSTTFTGLANALPFDIRLANIDNAGNVSAYTGIQTTTTLPSAADLEPGTVALSSAGFSVNENTFFSASIVRTGAGASSPAIEVDWAFSGFNQGTPSPANGTLSWASAENGSKLIQTTAGNVSANQTGLLRIVAVRALAGNISPTVGSPSQANVTIVVVNQLGKKWNPGFYAGTNNPTYPSDVKLANQQTEQALVLSSGARVLGWKGNYFTGALCSATPGVFDFTKLFRDLNNLRSMSPPKRLIILITPQQYGGSSYQNVLPAWVYNTSSYGPSPTAGKYGWWTIHGGTGLTAAFWRPAVMDFLISMLQALASTPNPATGLTVDQDPFVEWIVSWETSTPPDAGDGTYTTTSISDQFKRLVDAVSLAFPKTVFSVSNNFCGNKQLTQDLTNYCLAKGCGQGGPDTWAVGQKNPDLTWGQLAAIGVGQTEDTTFTGPDLRGQIAMVSNNEGPELNNATRYKMFTPVSFFNTTNNVLRQAHWVPTMLSINATDDPIPAYPAIGPNSGANPGNWHSIMQVINGHNLTHIQKPTSIP